MKYKLIKWVILWFLNILVTSSTLFSWCKSCKQKTMVEFQLRISDDQIKLTPSESNETVLVEKKNIIQDDNTNLYLTNEQKKYVYGLYPVVKPLFRGRVSTKFILYLIIDYLGAPLPTNQILPHTRSISFRLSADNQWAVACTTQIPSTMNLWNMASGEFVRVITDTSNTVCCFTSDSHYLISVCTKTKTLQLWAVSTGTLVHTFKGHTKTITSCSLSTDDQILLSTSRDWTVRLWAVRTGKCTQILTGHWTCVTWGQFCNRDQHVVSTGGSIIRIWDVNTGKCVRVLKTQSGDDIRRCVFSDNEQFLLSLGNEVTVWEFPTGNHVQTFHEHARVVQEFERYRHKDLTRERVVPYPVRHACFVRQDTHVTSIGEDHVLCIWRVHDAHCIHRFADYDRMIYHSYCLKSGGIECIIASTWSQPNYNGYELHVLNVESGETMFTFTGHSNPINSFCVSPDGRYVTSCSTDTGRVFIFAEHKKLQTF